MDPPPVLLPKSTISCLFVKKNCSFQGTADLLLYQGSIVNLALMFSVLFNYATHKIAFALAIITEQISRDLDGVFDNIIQGNGSPELKEAKYVLQMPRGP